ncbi:uncharacterized protein [Pempheris klunzingeri]|uniref:uncharacterized protein n=1 Tax=Pempheris klunzingeri TaxID=3127111 RepID=UPI0039803DDE
MGHCGSPRFPTPDLSYQRGVRYTYRYSTTITTTLHGSSAGRNGLALDCVVDIDVVSKCHLMMQIRNPQIKRLSPQKEHSVQRLKSLRESLERTRLKFSLHGGKVTTLCLQEGEQVWALNIKRALLSMLQTSRTPSKQELEKETDVYGTCTSRYERRGPVLLKSRDLNQCHQSRLADFWPHSVPLTEDTSVQSELHCVQRHGPTVMEEVNCTEVVSMATWSTTAGLVKTQTASTLLLLRAQPGSPSGADSPGPGVLTDLQFEDEGAARPGKARASTPQEASQTVRTLCSLTSDPQLVSQEFLQLAFQLRDLTLSQLKTLWQEASFKCRNDWQPLLDALPACGSENCILFLTDLMRNNELEEEQAQAFLTTIALIPRPSPQIIGSINLLLEVPDVRSKALLAGSSLVYQLCQRSQASCSELPQVQTFMRTLEETLKEGLEADQPHRDELLYGLKSVGNTGLSAPAFIPLLNRFMLGSAALELRLAAIQAFRRFPCSADRSVLLQLYRSSQEDPEVRIAAYQQLIRCPDQDVFAVVKTTLRNETSSQVGSYVWSHLTSVLRSEDPMKQPLIELLPDDIISRDFEAEFLKYSSYSEHTVSSGLGVTNVETSLVFSPKSFLPRSASANLTVYLHGRAHNLLEVDLRVENAEPLLKNIFGHQSHDSDSESAAQSGKRVQSKEAGRTRRKTHNGHRGEKETCLSSTNGYLDQARAMLFGRRKAEDNRPQCVVGVKVFGNELSVFTCEDLYNQMNQVSLSAAGLAVKLLKGHEVQLNHRAVLLTEELVLPSLSGLPVRLAINMTSLLSLRLKGNINYRDTSHFSLTGYIKPNAHVGLSARMGVDGALGQAAVDWVSELRSSTSLDGSVQLQEGRDLRVTLNTPEDVMDIISVSSRVFQLSGDHREEIKGPKGRVQKTTCTPKTWSKMVGWQLCSNASYPLPATGVLLPPPGPVHLSLRLLKLDRGLHYYLLEAAYSLLPQRGTWVPREASVHLLLATPQSSISRDMSLDLTFNPHRLLLRITHPLKTIHIQGQLEQERNIKSGKLELLIDGVHYYIMGLVDTQTLLSEQRTRYHLEAKMAAHGHPMILSANVTRGLGRKTSFSATLKNVFKETASLSVALERRRDGSSRQYSVETELLLPAVVGARMLGLLEQRGSLWSSALRLKYGLGSDARHLRQECYTSQRLRSERDSNLTYIMRADHEFYCSNTAPVNHKIHLRHEESPTHIKSALDMSYGKHWDEINNKRTLLLSQSFKNQSTANHTSYTLEFSLQVPEKNLNYRTQLLHSHLRQLGSESSTHLKINYNNLMPLVAGLHWKRPPKDTLQQKWEGTFSMDSPWLYIYTAHKLSRHQRHTLQLTSELTASKWLNIRNVLLEGFYRDRGREREARLELYTPAVTYIQAGGWSVVGKRSVKASVSLSSLWTPPLRGDVSLEASKFSHTLQMASTYGKHNVSLAAALNTVEKNLKKRQVIVKMTSSKQKSPTTELEFEGVVEELRRDKRMYQKTAMLQLRQPFQTFPQTLLLRETFTIDLLKGLYILESKAGFHGNREVIHTLTLGYKPPSPFLCSALTHPFSSDTVPSDSEICVTMTSNQTQKDIQGRLRVGSKERLTFFGQLQQNPLHSSHQAITIRANFSHQLQLQLPSSAIVEGNVCWNPKSNNDFDYQARGKLRVERQECQVKATADISTVTGRRSSLVHIRADGKDKVKLDAQMSHSLQRGNRAVGVRLNVSQSLVPSAADLHVDMAANMSSDSVSLHGSYTQGHEVLLVQVKGSLKNTRGLQLAVSGDLRHSAASLAIMPSVLGLDGALGHSDTLTEGQLRVRVMETLYSVELRHQEDSSSRNDEEGMTEKKFHVAHDWLCVWLGEEHVCVNVSRRLEDRGTGEVYTTVSHSFHLLNVTGVPSSSSAEVKWAQDGSRWMSVLAELQAGPEHLTAEFSGGKTGQVIPRWEYFSRVQHQMKALLKRGVSSSIQAKAHYQLETEGLDTGLVLHMEDERLVDILFNVGSKDGTVILGVSLWQQMKLLQGLVPTSLQRWALGVGLVVGPWIMDLNVGLRLEKPGLYGWHGLLEFGNLGVTHKAEVTGRVGLELGRCYFRGNLGKSEASQTEDKQSFYAVNVTNYCPALQGTVLPVSLALRGSLSVIPCQLTMTSSLRADSQDLSLELNQSCRPPRLSGALTHSFAGLSGRGVPHMVTVEATAPGGPEQDGALFIKAGTCYIRANRFIEAKGRTQWLWALESKCPMLQAHLNGSVWQSPQGAWTATVDTDLEGRKGFLRLNARPWPELSVEGELSHNLPALGNVPQRSRLRITSRARKQRYDTEAFIQMEECAVGARGVVMSQTGLQGSLIYHNNCTVVQEWGSPDRMQSSVLLVVSPTHAESEVSMVIDDRELQASVALKKTKDKNEAALNLNHSVPLLKKMGLPANAALTMNSGIHSNGSYYYLLHSGVGNQKGVFSQLQSRAQLTVDGHKLLASGLNVSVADGRLALLLSYAPPASNQTGTQPSLDAALSAQFKGPLRSASVDVRLHDTRVRVVGDLNQSQSSVAGLVEVLSGRRRLWALGELAAIDSGYRQALELKHSYPQVRALSSWSRSEETSETKLELTQPFFSTLSQMSFHTLSQSSQREQRSSHQTHLSWDSVVPVNVSLSLNTHWQHNSSKGQACALFSTQQMVVSSVKGCVSVGQEGNSYSQNAELRWDNRSIKQGMKYQKGPRGMHSLQVNVGLEKVSPAPCPSHTLLAKIQTNLRDRLEHTVLLGLCPPQPTLSWSGSHKVNSGEELFYTQSRLSVAGRPHQCSLTFALTNSSTAQGSNMSLFSESRMGNWSVEVGGSALSWLRGSGLQVQVRLDHREKIWLNGTVEGRCLQTTAGYMNGAGVNEDVTVAACVGTNRGLMLDVQKRDGSSKPATLGSVSVGSTNQRLMLRASGCSESLTAVEARIEYLSFLIRKKLLERIKTLQHLLAEFRRQSRDGELLQELSAVPLHVSQRAEALLGHRDRGLMAVWQSSPVRRALTDSLPRFLGLLQHASLLGQLELRRPLATLAGVYQDVKGQRPETLWREAVSLWTDGLVEVLPALLENSQLRPLAQASVTALSLALDVAGQHTYHWVETRLAMALSGFRKRLASVYKFYPSECLVIASLPLPSLPWSRVAEAGLVEILLEEWLLRPLQTLASVRPIAELYRLKRKIMDSPFTHQALLVADQFVVTFDGHLYELPGSCPLLLTQDISSDLSFTLLRSSDSHTLLLVEMNNSTINIQHNGQVKANCNNALTHTFHGDNGVAVRSGSNIVHVSNQNGASVSCDLSLEVCSFTLDGWSHGTSIGLFGTNDNEAGNDFPLPDGSQAENLDSFLYSWQMKPECLKPPGATGHLLKASASAAGCDFLFSSPDSPLSSCFRVVDPGQFLSVCELSSSRAPCRLASAFVHLCQRNYIPLHVPVQCLKV